jgi:signal transduction histidine kinase
MKSMRRQLTWWLVTTTILLVVAASAALYIYVRSALFKEFDAGLFAKAEGLSALFRIESDGQYDLDLTDQSLPEYLPGRRPEYFQIFMDGKVFEQSPSMKQGVLAISTDAIAQRRAWNLVLPDGRNGRAVGIKTTPMPEEKDKAAVAKLGVKLQPALIVVTRSRTDIDRILNTLLSSLIVAALVLAVACFVAVQLIVYYGLRSVNHLARQASTIGPDTLNDRFQSDNLPKELVPISIRLNDLLERLDNAFRRQRRLNSDIAHELRTPIAELRTLTEVGLRWPDAATAATYFRDANEIALKMESVIEVLLALARSQAQSISKTNEQVNLSDLIHKTLQSYEVEIDQKNLRLSCDISSEIVIYTDKSIFGRILQNLLSNAVKYTPENGVIGIVAELSAEQCVLRIWNTNESITAEDIPHLCESFWRKDSSRCDRSHVGLGLTLVSEYAQHLKMKVAPRLPQKDRFEIALSIALSPMGSSIATPAPFAGSGLLISQAPAHGVEP